MGPVKFAINWLMILVTVYALPLQFARAEEQLELPLGDQTSFPFMSEGTSLAGRQKLEWKPNDGGGIEKITMQALDVSSGDEEGAAAEIEKMIGSDPVSVTEIEPDRREKLSAAYYQRTARIIRSLHIKAHQTVKVNSKAFSEWFVANRVRVLVIAIEVTAVTGAKLLELSFASVPIPFASALMASVLVGGVLGGVDWNVVKVTNYIQKPGGLISDWINKLTNGAEASAKNIKVRTILEKAHTFAKSSAINFTLFSIFKILIFASLQTDGSFAFGLVESLHAFSLGEMASWAADSMIATYISAPTREVIFAQHMKDLAVAGKDPEKLAWAKTRLTIMSSSALTLRVMLFSSIVVAGAMHWPLMTVAAYSGLGLMYFGSKAKLKYDMKKTARRQRCEAVLVQ